MEFFNEYALLFAVAIPVAAIVGIQVFLFVAGERGTLLFPSLRGYPSIELRRDLEPGVAPEVNVAPALTVTTATVESSNDALEREVA